MTEEEKPGNGPNVHGMPSTLGMMGILAVGLIEQAGQGPTNVDQEVCFFFFNDLIYELFLFIFYIKFFLNIFI